MGAKYTVKKTADGIKLEQTLKELAQLEVRVGFQGGEAVEENGADIASVAAWNELGTAHIPSRPFIRQSVDNHEGEIIEFLESKKEDILNGASAEQVLTEIGIFQKDLMQAEITDGGFAANAPSTVRKKGSSVPLIDSGRMRQSVNYQIKAKGGGD